MIHRIMLAAALLAVPAIVVAEQPARVTTAHAQQADSSKAKPKTAKKGMHKKAGKTAAKPAAKDTSKAK
jgi:hypothetical protein